MALPSVFFRVIFGADAELGNRGATAGVLSIVQRGRSGARTGTEERKRDGHRVSPAVRILGVLLAAGYLTFITWYALRPLSVPWVYGTNVRPLATIERLVLADPMQATRTIGAGLVELAPLGMLFPMISGKLTVSTVGSLIRTVFLSAAVSFTLECLQTGVQGQVFDVDSLLLNTVGVALAYLAVVPGARARLRRRISHRPPRPGTTVRDTGAEPKQLHTGPTERLGAGVKGAGSDAAYEMAAHRNGPGAIALHSGAGEPKAPGAMR